MKSISKKIRPRFPRLIMSLVMAIIFWIVNIIVPPTMHGISVPGLDLEAEFLVWIVTMVITYVFLIRALSDVMILGNITTDIFVKRLGIKEEMSPKRAFRDFIYHHRYFGFLCRSSYSERGREFWKPVRKCHYLYCPWNNSYTNLRHWAYSLQNN